MLASNGVRIPPWGTGPHEGRGAARALGETRDARCGGSAIRRARVRCFLACNAPAIALCTLGRATPMLRRRRATLPMVDLLLLIIVTQLFIADGVEAGRNETESQTTSGLTTP
jgi:hypothetical protein